MNIQIGKVIRDLRINKEITQEELSQHLGVSVQAVSRWENGACYPDLELIPAIAAFFDVSADHLLCIDKQNNKENEERYVRLWTAAIKQAEHEKALEIANEALKVMPTNYKLMFLKAKSLFVMAGIYEETGDKEQLLRYLSKSEDTLRLIISKCNKNTLRFEAMEWLLAVLKGIDHCTNSDHLPEMLSLSKEFPDVHRSQNAILYRFFDSDDEKTKNYSRAYLYELFFEFFYCAYRLSDVSTLGEHEKTELLKGLLALLPIVVVNDSVGEFEYLVDGIYEKLYNITGDEEYKKQIGVHQKKYNELSDPHVYHSVFFDGIVFEKKKTIHDINGSC